MLVSCVEKVSVTEKKGERVPESRDGGAKAEVSLTLWLWNPVLHVLEP